MTPDPPRHPESDRAAPDSPWAAPGAPPQPVRRTALDEPTAALPVTAPGITAGAKVPLPRREGLRATIVVLTVTVLALIGIGVVGIQQRNPPISAIPGPLAPPGLAPPGLAATPTTPPGPSIYRAPGDLCEQADFTGLRPTFDQIGDLSPGTGGSAGVFQLAQCDGSTGNERIEGRFSFKVSVYNDLAAARRAYDTAFSDSRDNATKSGQLTYTTGEAGFAYLRPHGQGVEIYDGNLRIQLSWDDAAGKSPGPDGTVDALVSVCESTMKLLRDH